MRVKIRAHLIVDGYNVINCWPELLKKSNNLEHARDRLIHILLEYGAYEKYDVTVVFDALYTSSEQSLEKLNNHFGIVYTRKKETADSYIERMAYDLVHDGQEVYVVTSDGAEQNAVLGAGAYRMTVKELSKAVQRAKNKVSSACKTNRIRPINRNEIADRVAPNILHKLDMLRRKHYDDK